MKIAFRSWRWQLALGAGLLLGGSPLAAQQPLPSVELAQPLEVQPLDSETPSSAPVAGEPTPAAPPPATAKITDDPTEDAPAAELAEQSATPMPLPAPADDGEIGPVDAPSVEVVKERYPNGVVRIEREVTLDAAGNYIPHGLWRQYDQTGRLIAEGRFVRSQKEGIWRRLYRGDEAPLLASEPYRNFTPPFVSQATFSRGQLQGKWVITDAKERKAHELSFHEGERHGAATWFYPSGQELLSGQYDHGRATGELVQRDADGQVVAKETYEEGRKLAPKIEYHDGQEQAKKSEAMVLHAALAARAPDQWDTATLAAFEPRGQDEKHGPFTAWHPNGQLARQGEFRYDLPVGKFIYWYANGQKQMEGQYTDGRQDQQWVWWHENGLKSIAGAYESGTAVGPWSWWQASGKLAQKADLSEKSIAGPRPEVESESREAKVRLAEPVVELR